MRLTTIVGIAVTCACAAAQEVGNMPPGWLNAAEFGASGSQFETVATVRAGSTEIVVQDVGDFRVGQEVMVSRAFSHYTKQQVWGPDFARPRAMQNEIEIRGYDGSSGSWTAFLIEVAAGTPETFRWTDDIGRTWHEDQPITDEDGWVPLSGGTEVKFNRREWDGAYLLSFSARDQLLTVIEAIEGNTLTLRHAPNRDADDAVVRHTDAAALQAAIDAALAQRKHLYVPSGHYRISMGLVVNEPQGLVIEGQNDVDTIIDISDAEGACFTVRDGAEFTLRNFTMVGHTGFDRRDQCGALRTRGVTSMWGMYLKGCHAVGIHNTTRSLIENCHARRMATEAFYAQGRARSGISAEPAQYQQQLTYLRCSAIDCGRNGFNNNDLAENTSVLHCRIVDVGGCAWEGASRFVRFINNYVRNAGTVAMGNIGARPETLEELGSGQHIVANNVFEDYCPYGRAAIRLAQGGTQTIIRDNIFVNFDSNAIEVVGPQHERSMPARYAHVSGNIIDLTAMGRESEPRHGIQISASDVIVADNQVFVRGEGPDPQVTGIRIGEPSVNIEVHGNQISLCGTGIETFRHVARVGEVIDAQTFTQGFMGIPFERRRSHRYRGWGIAWVEGDAVTATSTITEFDPETLQFHLAEPRELAPGQVFEVFPPGGASWLIRDNTIASCLRPMVLDSYGSPTSVVRGNLIDRGLATGAAEAIELRGDFGLIGNQICGFDEPGSAALGLYPDRAGRQLQPVIRDNVFQRCRQVVGAGAQDLWPAATASGNVTVQ
ncbi:MAG: right-handed parallel beta-helix repeat-containing protein [Armatimonadota bacterium]